MSQQKKRTDTTSADKQQIGFEYQYLYFLLKLLQMSPGEAVGYEALDDIHIISASKAPTTYIQVKHTIDTSADGSQANLTALSDELWKTLSNWSKLISDPAECRTDKAAQIDFTNKSYFIILINRKIESNEVIEKIAQLKDGEINGSEIKTYLKQLKAKTSDKAIKSYIDDVNKLSPNVSSS